MTTAVTVDQLRNLADRAGRGRLTAAETALLRTGIDQMAQASDSELRRQLADTITALGKSETELAERRGDEKRIRAALALHQPIEHLGRTWCDACSTRRRTGPRTDEWVAFIPYPCPTVEALTEETP